MPLKPSPSNLCRSGGCTLTGALSVTTHVRDAVTVVHGPKGCSHHNFSLLHATSLGNDALICPNLVSTGLMETEIIFGGEQALDRTLDSVLRYNPGAIFVLSTCIVDTIGDDVGMVCGKVRGVPVIPVPTAGFLGGTFQNGVNNALIALAGMAAPGTKNESRTVNIIGEKNLEYEVRENYGEVSRLLSEIGVSVNTRFVHDIPSEQIARLGEARLNILRDPALIPVGKYLKNRLGIPYIPSFPFGISGTFTFLKTVADACGVKCRDAVDAERALQVATLADFSDLAGSTISLENALVDQDCIRTMRKLARALNLKIKKTGKQVPLPATPPVGVAGMRRMLHRWRRAIHA